MKAMVYRAHGGASNLKLEDIPVPSIQPDEALVRVRAVALNGFDPMMLQATTKLKVPLPMIPCGDFAGEIAQLSTNSDSSQWRVSDRVAPFPVIEGKGLMGETVRGVCCEYVTVPVKNLVRMPDNIAFTDAASLSIAYGTALRMLTVRGQVREGEKVLILGATGGVGVCCVQLAVVAGAEVIACGSSAAKTAKLRELGATHVIDTSTQDFLAVIHALYGKPGFYGGGGVDVVVNYIGGDTWVPSLKCLKQGGRLLVCGATAGYDPKEDLRYIWSFEHAIMGSNGWSPKDQATLMNMVVAGTLKPVIHSIRRMEEAPEAMQELIDRRVFGKSVLTV